MSTPQARFSQAVKDGRVDEIRALMDQEANPNSIVRGETTLFWASSQGHVELVTVLLERGASLQLPSTPTGWLPLHGATAKGRDAVVRALLDYGADANARSTVGDWTALHLACEHGHAAIAELLMDRGATHATNFRGATPLHVAAHYGRNDIVNLLLDRGADIEAKCKKGTTPLFASCEQGHANTARLLISRGANVAARNKAHLNPLHSAAHCGSVETVEVLLHAGSPVVDEDPETYAEYPSPLEIASSRGHEAVVRLLLRVRKSWTKHDANSAITRACEAGHVGVVAMLLDAGAHKNTSDILDPVWKAATYKHAAVVELLLARRATLVKDRRLCTPVHAACGADAVGVVRVFVRRFGTQILHSPALPPQANTGNYSKVDLWWTPLVQACYSGSAEVVRVAMDEWDFSPGADHLRQACRMQRVDTLRVLLRAKPTVPSDVLRRAVNDNMEQIVTVLLDNGVPPDVQDRRGWTPLMHACRKGLRRCAEMLLDAGASPDAIAPTDGTTPLLEACRGLCTDIVRMLLQRGAVTAADGAGNTPMLVAARVSRGPLVEVLLEFGVPQGPSKVPHKTPLYEACKRGCAAVANLLLDRGDANVDYPDLEFSPVYACLTNGLPEVACKLLKRGAVADRPGASVNLLAVACTHGYKEVVEELLARGARANPPDVRWTPLFCAAKNGHVDIVRALLDGGATNPARDSMDEWTPLRTAAKHGHAAVVEVLLDRLPPPKPWTAHPMQETAINVAVKGGHADVVRVLTRRVPWSTSQPQSLKRYPSVVLTACEGGNHEVARLLIDSGVLPLCADKDMCLIYAAAKDMTAVCEALLDAGANPSATMRYSEPNLRSAMRAACASNNLRTVRLLLERNAEILEKGTVVFLKDLRRDNPKLYKVLLDALLSRPDELRVAVQSTNDECPVTYDIAMRSAAALCGTLDGRHISKPLVGISGPELRSLVVTLARVPQRHRKRGTFITLVTSARGRPKDDVIMAFVLFSGCTREEIHDIAAVRLWSTAELEPVIQRALALRDGLRSAERDRRSTRMSWPVWQRLVQTYLGVPPWWFSEAWWEGRAA